MHNLWKYHAYHFIFVKRKIRGELILVKILFSNRFTCPSIIFLFIIYKNAKIGGGLTFSKKNNIHYLLKLYNMLFPTIYTYNK